MEYVLNLIGMPQYGIERLFAPLGALGRHLSDHFIPHARNNYHPHFLGHRALALFSVLLVTAKIFTVALLAWGPIVPAFSSAITEANIITLTNQSRTSYSEGQLIENVELDKAAQAKADDMLARGYFAHTTPDGRTPWSFITAAGYSYLMAGENLAVNFTEVEDVETAWMNSPGHRANILNKDFQEIGIGISQGVYQGHTAIFVVQEFGTPAGQQIALSNQPTIVQTTPVPLPASGLQQQSAPPSVFGSSIAIPNSPPPAAPVAAIPASAEPLANQYQTLTQNNQSAQASSIYIEDGQVSLDKNNVDITATVSGTAVKVLAYFGQQAIMLTAGGQNIWKGQVPVSSLLQTTTTVRLDAVDMQGRVSHLQLADFSPDTVNNFSLLAGSAKAYVTFLGQTFDPQTAEGKFYLLFTAALLTSLIIAIAVKRHVQHLSLIANSSFVIILAMMLWWGGG